jgi:hypothetical protein
MSASIRPDTMYRYGHIDGGLGTMEVTGLVPTQAFEDFMGEMVKLRGRGATQVKRLRQGYDITEDDPGFYEVELHPDFDVLRSGGPLGTTILSSRPHDDNELPAKLEEFTDEQLAMLAGNSAIRLVQLNELRNSEIELTQTNPNYRIATPYPE